MKRCYVKTLLYAYPNLLKIIRRIDELVEKRAINSKSVHSDCLVQCEKIISLTSQKGLLYEIKYYLDIVIDKLSREQRDYLEYKYFKKLPKDYFNNVNFQSRNYYRKQQKLLERISECLDWMDKGDEWFETRCKQVSYIKKLLVSVELNELGRKETKSKAKNKTDAKSDVA